MVGIVVVVMVVVLVVVESAESCAPFMHNVNFFSYSFFKSFNFLTIVWRKNGISTISTFDEKKKDGRFVRLVFVAIPPHCCMSDLGTYNVTWKRASMVA